MKETTTEVKELKPQGDLVFSLDIGTRTVVGIIGRYEDEKFCLQDYVSVPHTKRAMIDGQVEDIKQVAKIVAQAKAALEERNGVKLTTVSIAAAGRALKTKVVTQDFDVTDKDTLTEDLVKSMEIETIQKAQSELDAASNGKTLFYCVGHSIISYKLDDYSMISLVGHKGDKVTIELVAAFLPSIVIEGLYAVMDLNGLEVNNLTLEPIAAMNVIVPPEIRLINIALVDIGAGTSDIAIAKNGAVCAYAMATTAGDELTEELIKTCLVDFNTAEMMKRACSSDAENVEYKDILGAVHTVPASDITAILSPAVESLADTICNEIHEVNGESPAAVFLVGGGSLIGGLANIIAEKLGLDESRVAIGGGDFLKNVDATASKLGAEYVTPLGIAVTAMLDQGYDFSVVIVNDRKVRVFDTKQLSVYEALTMAGYKSAEIMGRSGRNLSYTLNGTHTLLKGGAMTPAEVYVNEKPASIMTKVTQGDRIRIVPAICGENAAAKLSNVLNYGRFKSGMVTFGGEQYEIGLKAFVNGEEKAPDYQIQPLDSIESTGIVTLGDLLISLDIELAGLEYRVGEGVVDEEYALNDGDVIDAYDSYGNKVGSGFVPKAEDAEEEPEEVEDNEETAEESAPVEAAMPEQAMPAPQIPVQEAPIAQVPEQTVQNYSQDYSQQDYTQQGYAQPNYGMPMQNMQPDMPQGYAPEQSYGMPMQGQPPMQNYGAPMQQGYVPEQGYGMPVQEQPPMQSYNPENGAYMPTDKPFSSFTYTREQLEAMIREDGGKAAFDAIAKELGIERPQPMHSSESANAIPFNRKSNGAMTITLNGSTMELPPRSSGYLLLDLVSKVDIDPAVPNSEIILEINGKPATFGTEISDGDNAVIRVQERKFAR